MDMNDLILVSVDDHVVEPPDMFERHVSKADLERAPAGDRTRTRWTPTCGRSRARRSPTSGSTRSRAVRPRSTASSPTAFDEIRKGCYDIHERVRDMNVNGVLGSMCFPSMTGFCGQLFSRTPDRDLGYRLLQGYNDWHIDEWCGTYPGRFIPLAIVPHLGRRPDGGGDPPRRREGLSRGHVLGEPRASSATRASTPTTGTRSSRACEETGTVVCLHIGSSSSISVTSDDAPIDVMITTTP